MVLFLQIGPSPDTAPIRISNTTQFQHGSENAWVTVEKYLIGKVVNAGGKQEPNVHLILADTGETIKVDATEQQLAGEKENQLYKDVTLRVHAEQHLRTKALRNLRLIQFAPQANQPDEQALDALWQKGRKAWKDVKSAAGWVEALRGNQSHHAPGLARHQLSHLLRGPRPA